MRSESRSSKEILKQKKDIKVGVQEGPNLDEWRDVLDVKPSLGFRNLPFCKVL